MIGNTLQSGLAALLGSVRDNWPEATLADMQSAWAKIAAGQPLAEGAEHHAGIQIQANRVVLDSLVAVEQAPVRTSLEAQAENALADLRAYRDATSPTNAQTVAIVKVLCRVCIALVRLHLRRLHGGAEPATSPPK